MKCGELITMISFFSHGIPKKDILDRARAKFVCVIAKNIRGGKTLKTLDVRGNNIEN